MFTLQPIRQRLIDKVPAIFASIYVPNIFCDLWLYWRYINNLMMQRSFACFFKICAAKSTYFFFETKMFFYQLLRQKLPQILPMSILCSSLLRRCFGNTTDIQGGSDDCGLEKFLELIPKSCSSYSILFFNIAFSSSKCFIYASLSMIKSLSDKNTDLLKFTSIPRNWLNAY